MKKRRIRSTCRKLLRAIDVQPPLEVIELATHVGILRGRPIELVEHALTDELALSFSMDDKDVIAWRPHTSSWHRDHSIAHELGHILCGHLDGDYGDYGDYGASDIYDISKIMARFTQNEPPSGATRRRVCYDTPQEAVVELIATTFLQWAIVPGHAPDQIPQGLGQGAGLYRTLSYHRGWM